MARGVACGPEKEECESKANVRIDSIKMQMCLAINTCFVLRHVHIAQNVECNNVRMLSSKNPQLLCVRMGNAQHARTNILGSHSLKDNSSEWAALRSAMKSFPNTHTYMHAHTHSPPPHGAHTVCPVESQWKWWARGSGFPHENFNQFHPRLPPEKAKFLFCLAYPPPPPVVLLLSTLAPKWAALTLTQCTQHCVPVSHLHVAHQNPTSTCFSTAEEVLSCPTQLRMARTAWRAVWTWNSKNAILLLSLSQETRVFSRNVYSRLKKG